MDVLLLAGAATLPPICSRCSACHTAAKTSSRLYSAESITLGLSFCLLSLSVLETIPSAWLILLDNQEDAAEKYSIIRNGYVTLRGAYIVVLWALSVFILVILPCLAGTQALLFLFRRQAIDPDEEKKKSFHAKRKSSRVLQFGNKLIFLVFKVFYYTLSCASACVLRRFRKREDGPILALTNRDVPASSSNSQVAKLIESSRRRRSIFLGSVFGISLAWSIVGIIAPLFIQTTEDITSLSGAVSFLCAIGILVSALLNGFGSVSMPHSCLAGLYLEPVTPEAVAKAETELIKARRTLTERREEIGTLGLTIQQSSLPGMRSRRSFVEMGGEVAGDKAQQKSNLLSEIDFLATLVNEMQEDVIEMRYSQEMFGAARTTMGRLRSLLGVVFSVILLVRLFSATMCIWGPYKVEMSQDGSSRVDPVTMALSWLMGHSIVTRQDYSKLSQLISLLLSAVLSFSQVRNLLRTVNAINNRLRSILKKCHCRNSGKVIREDGPSLSTGVYSHILSFFIGCYFIACIVLTKMILPQRYRAVFSAALGGNDIFRIRSYSVNLVFSLSAVVSAAVLGMLLGIQRQNSQRYRSTWNEGKKTSGNFEGRASFRSPEP